MIERDRPEFVTLLTWLAKQYPLGRDNAGKLIPRRLNEIDLGAYFAALADVPIGMVERGVRWHHGHSEFFPDRPAALRKSIEAAPKPPPLPLYRSPVALLPEVAEANRVNIAAIRERLQALFTLDLAEQPVRGSQPQASRRRSVVPKRTLEELQRQREILLTEGVS